MKGIPPQDFVEIEVEDPKKGDKKTFKSLKEVLLSQVPYFEKYLKNNTKGYQVKIQVLSDVNVFDWIIQYAEYAFCSSLSSSEQ